MSERWAVVKAAGSVEEAALVAGYLRSHGIAAHPESRHAHPELALGHLGSVRVLVPPELVEEALRLLADPGWRSEAEGLVEDERREKIEESSAIEEPSGDRFSPSYNIEPR